MGARRAGGVRRGAVLACALACGTLACSGDIVSPGTGKKAPARVGGAGGGGGPSPAEACAAPVSGASPLRRLTRVEYENTLRELLGVTDSPAQAFPPDAIAMNFDNIAAAQTVSQVQVEQYETQAARLAAQAVADLPKLLGCAPTPAAEDACVRAFVASFGRRAFRRPLDPEEAARLHAFYLDEKAKYGFAPAVEQLLTVFLQSPHFVYRPEFGVGTQGGLRRLSGYELASRLSYYLWASMPDAALLDAAESGRLDTPAGVVAEATRLLADPRARAAIAHFYAQWLDADRLGDVSKDRTIYPSWSEGLRNAFRREAQAFLEELFFGADTRLRTFYKADFTYADRALAQFYGATAAGTAFERVALPAGQRSGFLTQGAFLAVHAKPDMSSPIDRGKFIRERLLCEDLPAPPNNVEIVPPKLTPNTTTRQRFEEHNENASCRGCHQMIDPVGLGLERYDGIGAYRDLDQGLPVDDTGEIVGTDVAGSYRGAGELTDKLAQSAQAQACVARQLFRFALGREETAADACALAELDAAFAASGHDLRGLVIDLVATRAFQHLGGAP